MFRRLACWSLIDIRQDYDVLGPAAIVLLEETRYAVWVVSAKPAASVEVVNAYNNGFCDSGQVHGDWVAAHATFLCIHLA